MKSVVLLGAGFGLGLFLLVRILLPTRLPLSVALARADAASAAPLVPARRARPREQAGVELSRVARRVQRLEWLLGERYADLLLQRGLLNSGLQADLALLGRDPHAYTARKLLQSLAALLGAPLLLVPLAALSGLPWLVGAWLAVLLAAVVFVLPDSAVGRKAKAYRRDFATAMAAYLDLVAMRAASGSGVMEALRDAARIGSGPAFALLREALEDARMSGAAPSAALGELGDELDVVELRQLSSQLQLISSSGAQAESSLRAKADALRSRQLAEAQGGANERSQTMLVGQIMLGFGFLIFLGYPAVAEVLTL